MVFETVFRVVGVVIDDIFKTFFVQMAVFLFRMSPIMIVITAIWLTVLLFLNISDHSTLVTQYVVIAILMTYSIIGTGFAIRQKCTRKRVKHKEEAPGCPRTPCSRVACGNSCMRNTVLFSGLISIILLYVGLTWFLFNQHSDVHFINSSESFSLHCTVNKSMTDTQRNTSTMEMLPNETLKNSQKAECLCTVMENSFLEISNRYFFVENKMHRNKTWYWTLDSGEPGSDGTDEEDVADWDQQCSYDRWLNTTVCMWKLTNIRKHSSGVYIIYGYTNDKVGENSEYPSNSSSESTTGTPAWEIVTLVNLTVVDDTMKEIKVDSGSPIVFKDLNNIHIDQSLQIEEIKVNNTTIQEVCPSTRIGSCYISTLLGIWISVIPIFPMVPISLLEDNDMMYCVCPEAYGNQAIVLSMESPYLKFQASVQLEVSPTRSKQYPVEYKTLNEQCNAAGSRQNMYGNSSDECLHIVCEESVLIDNRKRYNSTWQYELRMYRYSICFCVVFIWLVVKLVRIGFYCVCHLRRDHRYCAPCPNRQYKYDIFLSYADESNIIEEQSDKLFALETLCPLFNQLGYKTCTDEDIEFGENRLLRYQTLIPECRVMVIVYSEDYIKDEHCAIEQIQLSLYPLIEEGSVDMDNVLLIFRHNCKLHALVFGLYTCKRVDWFPTVIIGEDSKERCLNILITWLTNRISSFFFTRGWRHVRNFARRLKRTIRWSYRAV